MTDQKFKACMKSVRDINQMIEVLDTLSQYERETIRDGILGIIDYCICNENDTEIEE